MEAAMRRLGPHLLRMTDGETGERAGWITPTLAWLRANPDIELVRDGDGSDYESGAVHRVRRGRSFDPNNIELNYYRTFQRRLSRVVRSSVSERSLLRHQLPE